MKKINEKELKKLIIDLKNNVQSAIEELYIKYNSLIYGIAFSILKNKEDSEDVVQTVFTKLYKIDKNKLPIKKEASWLYTVTKNEALAILKKKEKNPNLENIYEIEDSNNELNNIIEKDSYNKLINKLNNKEKQIISLKILSNLSFEEISILTNEPTGTVKWRYYKSINRLKLILTNLGMFVITFIIGVKEIFLTNKTSNLEQQENKDITINNEEKVEIQEDISEQKNKQEDVENNKQEVLQNEQKNLINEQTLVSNENISNSANTGICFISISLVFFILTIICLKFFKKYQLKIKK